MLFPKFVSSCCPVPTTIQAQAQAHLRVSSCTHFEPPVHYSRVQLSQQCQQRSHIKQTAVRNMKRICLVLNLSPSHHHILHFPLERRAGVSVESPAGHGWMYL